jgi:hypothetical protein
MATFALGTGNFVQRVEVGNIDLAGNVNNQNYYQVPTGYYAYLKLLRWVSKSPVGGGGGQIGGLQIQVRPNSIQETTYATTPVQWNQVFGCTNGVTPTFSVPVPWISTFDGLTTTNLGDIGGRATIQGWSLSGEKNDLGGGIFLEEGFRLGVYGTGSVNGFLSVRLTIWLYKYP